MHLAEGLILKKLNSNDSVVRNRNALVVNPSQQRINDPLDLFLAKCGVSTDASLTITNPIRQRSAKEELAFFLDRVQGYESFEEFWNTYQYDLPSMAALVRAYSIRSASSVASESLFSIAGYVQRKQRSSLAANTLRYSMALRDRSVLASLISST
jgi:hypothetical protein